MLQSWELIFLLVSIHIHINVIFKHKYLKIDKIFTTIIDALILYYNYQGGVNTTNGFELVDFGAIFLRLAGVCSQYLGSSDVLSNRN